MKAMEQVVLTKTNINNLFDELFFKLEKIETLFAIVNLEYFFNFEENTLRNYFSMAEQLTRETIIISKELLSFISQGTQKNDLGTYRG